MHLPEEPDQPLDINILPMVDVLFVVLIFVILVSLGAARIVGLPVNLPSAETAEATETEPLTVTIQADGAILVAQAPIALEQLIPTVEAQRPASGIILLNADTQVTHGAVVAVLDRLRQVDGVQLAIATEPLASTPTPSPASGNTPASPPELDAPSPQQSPLALPSN